MSNRREVWILRGLPGMGKSHMARILHNSLKDGERAQIVSADHYFIHPDGSYNYFASGIEDAHRACYRNFIWAIEQHINVIIVDNVNYKRIHFEKYADLANYNSYRVIELVVGTLDVDLSFSRNTHNVPRATIENMARLFEL